MRFLNVKALVLFLAFSSPFVLALPEEEEAKPKGEVQCAPTVANMGTVASDFAARVAEDAEKRRIETEARRQSMTEQVLVDIRDNSDTVDALEAATERLRQRFAIRPEDSNSELLKESVGRLKEYGESTQTVLTNALDLGRKVGAVKVMGGKDGMITKGLKMLPWIGGYVQTAQERNQSGQDAITNLHTVVDDQVKEIRRVDKITKTDEMNWRKEFQDLWNKADDLAAVRDAVKATSENLDGLTTLQQRAYEQFIDELETAELIFRDLAESLQQQVLMNITVQKSLKETQKVLQTKTRADLRKLAGLIATIAGQDTAMKGQELAQKITEGVNAAETQISQDLKESTERMTALLKGIGDRTATEASRELRRQASQSWKQYDQEIRGIRAQRNTELKESFKKGLEEIQEHEIKAKTSAAVVTDADPIRAEAPQAEVKPATKPNVRPQS